MEKLSRLLVKDVMHYAMTHKMRAFKLEQYYDEDIDVFFFKHNEQHIKENIEFYEYIAKKMNEYFFSSAITNVCFYYDYEFSQSCRLEPSLPDGLLDNLFSKKQDEKANNIKVILPKKECSENIKPKLGLKPLNIAEFKSLKKEFFIDNYKKIKREDAA